MRQNYIEMPNGYQESIQKGLSTVRYFSRNMSYRKGTREDVIDSEYFVGYGFKKHLLEIQRGGYGLFDGVKFIVQFLS